MAKAATPALLAAQRAGVQFTVHEYRHDPTAPSYGQEAVEALGLDPNAVFKTLIASVDGKLAVAVVPVAGRLSLKALAAALNGKKAELADPEEAERATGYVLGGISPLGQRKRLQAVVDSSALNLPTIHVSAGRRGLEIALAPEDLVRLIDARTAPITE